MGSEIDQPRSAVPDLALTPASTITAEDLTPPRLYIGQQLSAAVTEELAQSGDIYLALGADDPAPNVIYKRGETNGVLFHVIGVLKGKSYTDSDGELHTFRFDDPEAPAECWTTYTYFVVLPEVDREFPAKWLLTKSARPSARQINTVHAKTASKGPSYQQAFRVTTKLKHNPQGKPYYVPVVTHVEAKPEDVELCAELQPLIAASAASAASTQSGDDVTDAPSI